MRNIQRLFLLLAFIFAPLSVFAEPDNNSYSIDEMLERRAHETPCATAVLRQAMAYNANMIENPDDASSTEIDTWVHFAFSQPDTLRALLDCPEIQQRADDETIIFETASYTFSNGRTIQINYETQKRVLKQKFLLAGKKWGPGDINPDIANDIANGAIWINVDPAWYAILVAEHGSMDAYVGPGKNNIVAANYIKDNIRQFYPQDHAGAFRADCTSRSAIAGDTDMINRATTITVGGVPPRTESADLTTEEREQLKTAKNNDYYVMGDTDLRWISALEVTADVALIILTSGVSAAAKGFATGLRATRTLKSANATLKTIKTSAEVTRWTNITNHTARITKAINTADKIEDSAQTLKGLTRTYEQTINKLQNQLDALRKAPKPDAKQIKTIEQELEFAKNQTNTAQQALKNADKITDAQNKLKNNTKLTAQETEKLQNEIKTLTDSYKTELQKLKNVHETEIAKLAKTDDVVKYQELVQAKREAAHTAYLLRQGKIAFQAKRGLLPMRAYRAAKSLRNGIKAGKNLDKTSRIVRAHTSGFSTKIKDWLFHNTIKNLPAATKLPASLAVLNTIVKAVGNMYDYSEVTTAQFTNGVDLHPYLLLAADNLPGFENIVNHGMWLFWTGSSTSANDDDAAFLEAMSFAEKFHQDLVEVQDEYNVMACDVDIYVVRPIIRNPDTDDAEVYYLFMNETPWTTHGYNTPNDGTGETSIPRRNQTPNEPQKTETSYGTDTGLPAPIQETDVESAVNQPTSADYYKPAQNLYTNGAGHVSHLKKIGTVIEPAYDGTRIGMPCTKPSARAGEFTNEILTTGRYASVSPAFEKAMITKFRTEGECVDHPADSGGYTCYGVSSKYFPEAKEPGFTRADAEDIAWNHFFRKYHMDKLPDAISGDVFMALWGTGSKDKSVGLLQHILGVSETGFVNDETITAAKNYRGDLRTKFLDARKKNFLKSRNSTFLQGWLNALDVYRANGCHTVAQDTIP